MGKIMGWLENHSLEIVFFALIVLFGVFGANQFSESKYHDGCVSWGQANTTWNPQDLSPNGSCNPTFRNQIIGDFKYDKYFCTLPNGTQKSIMTYSECEIYGKIRAPKPGQKPILD